MFYTACQRNFLREPITSQNDMDLKNNTDNSYQKIIYSNRFLPIFSLFQQLVQRKNTMETTIFMKCLKKNSTLII